MLMSLQVLLGLAALLSMVDLIRGKQWLRIGRRTNPPAAVRLGALGYLLAIASMVVLSATHAYLAGWVLLALGVAATLVAAFIAAPWAIRS